MTDYKIKSKVSNRDANIISNMQTGSIVAAGVFLVLAGICTSLLKVEIEEDTSQNDEE